MADHQKPREKPLALSAPRYLALCAYNIEPLVAAELRAPVRFLGRVSNADLPRLYACADVYTMLCRNRWGGLEQ